MRYFTQRARKKVDLALLLKCCPHCLGDLEFRSDFSGEFYMCLQCNARAEPASKAGRLAGIREEKVAMPRPEMLPNW